MKLLTIMNAVASLSTIVDVMPATLNLLWSAVNSIGFCMSCRASMVTFETMRRFQSVDLRKWLSDAVLFFLGFAVISKPDLGNYIRSVFGNPARNHYDADLTKLGTATQSNVVEPRTCMSSQYLLC